MKKGKFKFQGNVKLDRKLEIHTFLVIIGNRFTPYR